MYLNFSVHTGAHRMLTFALTALDCGSDGVSLVACVVDGGSQVWSQGHG